MERHKALFIILALRLADPICAAPARNDASGRQLELAAEDSASQPRRLVSGPSAEQSISLLAIMQHLQQRHLSVEGVASEVRTEGQEVRMDGQSTHERQLLADMGHLESQLESWKDAEQHLEQQVAQQSETVNTLKLTEAKAIHDEQVAAVVWWDCKMLMCLVLASGLAFCIYATSSQNPKINFDAVEQAPQPARRARAQPEFVEKDAKPEAEDILEVMLHPVPHTTLEENVDLEAASTTSTPLQKDALHIDTTLAQSLAAIGVTVEGAVQSDNSESTPTTRRLSQCQYFNLEEEAPTRASTEDAWWNESASGY